MEMLRSLAPAVNDRLDELTATLVERCGTSLVGLVVHGSAVRGGWSEGTSDVDLIVVLDDDSEAMLAAIGPALELARFSARIEAMILTKDEIERSADCFPLLYGDIGRTSVTIAGTNPFTDLSISHEHIRLRVEQELREIRIRMRRVATDMAGTPHFGGAVEHKVKQLRSPLWALLTLRNESVDDHLDSVLDGAARAYGIDVAPLLRARDEPAAAYTTLAKLLDAALDDVDTWTPERGNA
jgi:predicted nucleotidyltransferase